jgi:DNA-binding response OmpR family regulator
VDEDARLLSMIEEKLRASPQLFTVRTAGNGHIALRVLREFQPHVMLLDPGMPKPGGVALCREAGPAAHGRGARIIALVRPSDQELIAVAREYGIDVCLSRAAALDTIKYEVWRLAQEATKEAYAGQGR